MHLITNCKILWIMSKYLLLWRSDFRHNVIMHALVMYVWLLYREMISSSLHIWSYSDYFAAILVFWHLKTNLKLFQLQKLLKVLMRPTPISIYLNSATKAYPASPTIVLGGKKDWTMPYILWKLNCEYIWHVEPKSGLVKNNFSNYNSSSRCSAML